MLGWTSVADVAVCASTDVRATPLLASVMIGDARNALPRFAGVGRDHHRVTKMRHSVPSLRHKYRWRALAIKFAARREPRRPIGRSRFPRATPARGCGMPAPPECGFRRPRADAGWP